MPEVNHYLKLELSDRDSLGTQQLVADKYGVRQSTISNASARLDVAFGGRWSTAHRAARVAAKLRRDMEPLMQVGTALLAVNDAMRLLIIQRSSGLPADDED